MSAPAAPIDGRKLRWHQHKEERRRHIIDAALAVISEHRPGDDIHVQEIAERAGLSRTVVYRHFEDRADLDRAVRTRIVDDLWERLAPEITLDGTITSIIERIVSTYVGWAAGHPSLHRLAEQGDNLDHDPMRQGIERIGTRLVEILDAALTLLDLEPSDDQRAALDPLSFGLVGAVLGAVRRWLSRPERAPDAATFVVFVSDSVWFILQGHAQAMGFDLDPDLTLQELILEALEID